MMNYKNILKKIVLLIIIIILSFSIVFILFRFYLYHHDIEILQGRITSSVDETIYIETEERDYRGSINDTLELMNDKFHNHFNENDQVIVFCRVSPQEVSPAGIEILYMIKTNWGDW